MAAQDYPGFVQRMIERYEGGYGWDRNDPGGPTKFGVTAYDLAEHRHEIMDSFSHWAPLVQAMTMQEALDVYAQKYATACAFYDLNPGKDCVVLDFGVNSGPSRSVKTAQRLCDVHVDGVLGPKTLAAINAYEPVPFIDDLCAARLLFLRGLRIWPDFGRGWTARINDLKAYSKGLLKPKVRKPGPARKLTRIPKAFAKGWE